MAAAEKELMDEAMKIFEMDQAEKERAAKRRKYKDAWYPSPINLEPRRVGNMEITHRIMAEDVYVVGQRQAFTRGLRPVRAALKEPLRIHELRQHHKGRKGSSLWMTDLPEELNQIGEMLFNVKPKGHVLIGGLGLGLCAAAVAALDKVQRTVVVEKNANVIKLCDQGTAHRYEVIKSDILTFLKDSPVRFDYYLLDTWAGTNEMEWWGTVLPLRRAIRNKWGRVPVIHCWAEDIMQGQVGRSLQMGKDNWYYKGLPKMSYAMACNFMNDAGSMAWEKRYGAIVDANYTREK